MKKVLLCAIVFTPALLIGQQDFSTYKADASIKYFNQESDILREQEIWSEDFTDGISASWNNYENGGVAFWEYRGPATTPDNETGSVGSCFPAGSQGSDAIQSETEGNGFVIFDSGWWDDPIGPCGNFGTGAAPAPHFAVLESPSIDLSAYSNVGISFSQYIKNYEADSRLEVSTDGGVDWVIVWSNYILINQYNESNGEVVRAEISAEAGGQANVKFRFVFEGLYYFWMLDDIKLLELDDNNMHVNLSTYGDFDFTDPDHPTGFEFMEYGQYPDEMAPLLKFTTWAENYGAETQTEVGLDIEVVNEGNSNVIQNGSSTETFNVQPSGESELRAGQYQMPASIANYQVNFSVFQNETEQSPDDNVDSLNFKITDVTYARDKGPVEAAYVPLLANEGQPFETGNVYVITDSDINAHSISVALINGSVLPATIYGAIYEMEIDKTVTTTLIGITEDVAVTADMLNDDEGENMVILTFASPLALQQGHAYLVVAACEQGHEHMLVGVNGDSPDLTTWRKYGNSDLGYILATVMVRLNIGPYIDALEISLAKNEIALFPNPANDVLSCSIQSDCNQQIDISVFDVSGRNISGEIILLHVGENSFQFDTHQLADGCYHLELKSEMFSSSKQFVVKH